MTALSTAASQKTHGKACPYQHRISKGVGRFNIYDRTRIGYDCAERVPIFALPQNARTPKSAAEATLTPSNPEERIFTFARSKNFVPIDQTIIKISVITPGGKTAAVSMVP